ncbi:serine/threonine-protein kinase/endoribonuclease IRE1 protein [Dioscorea alata]|uniref:Serine/threonine-protein kinase/endoribonuclease IRE1 protein n=1 Tax=Dioscorea alata TaxID=55571 RepID=A0ACB7UUY5_DIOAL|nr:serine/threonine-protein kinase/endoribonuclease IRE1 protein [Dioscorea alata]
MRSWSPSLLLFLIVVAGFLISGALTPSAWKTESHAFSLTSDEVLAAEDLWPPSQKTPGIPSRLALPPPVVSSKLFPAEDPARTAETLAPASRSILSFDSVGEFGKILVVRENGTLRLRDTKTSDYEWEISTGSRLKEQWTGNGTEHFYSIGEDWALYEHHKEFGKRKLDMTLEESIYKLTKVDGRTAVLGSISTTIIYVDESSGKILFRYTLPSVDDGEFAVDEKAIQEFQNHARTGSIMTIVRKDYSLKSLSFGETLWSLRAAQFTAYRGNKENQLLPSANNAPAVFPLSGENVPVYFMPEDYVHPLPSDPHDPIALDSSNETQTLFKFPLFLHGTGNVSFGEEEGAPSTISSTVLSASSGPSWSFVASTSQLDNTTFSPPDMQTHIQPYRDDDTSLVRPSHSAEVLQVTYGIFALLVILIVILACALYVKLRGEVKSDKQLIGIKGIESTVPNSKKRRNRKVANAKNGVIANRINSPNSSENENFDANKHKNNERYPFLHLVRDNDANDGRWIGRLLVLNSEIAVGSNGTVVFEGVYDGRPVAVKRLLRAHHDIAFKEIQNLIASDQHPNIVRWHGVEQDIDFVYISLERCLCSLGDLIQLCANSSSDTDFSKTPDSTYISELKLRLDFPNDIDNLELWREDGFPSSRLLKLMRDVVSGLVHLHEIGIIHRDLKPQNILISSDKFLTAKLSDMGISKRLPENMSSLGHHATGYGSSGWQAPEQLLHGRQTRAVDLFSLGCILFFCITKGKHPFGNHFERDANIINNRVDLFLVDHIPEAVHLLSQLLDAEPDKRPSAIGVLHHPFFWSSEMRLSFLRDVSDRVEQEERGSQSELLEALENVSPVAFGGKWNDKLDSAFINDMGRYRKYNFEFTRDLLRVIRNKLSHYRELANDLQEILGPVPEGFDNYFSKRFPNLLIEVYKVISRYCRQEVCFQKYYESILF